MCVKINAMGTFVEPEVVSIMDCNYVELATIGGKWAYGYYLDCDPIKERVECSVLNEMFETRENALQAALIQLQHKVLYASSYRQYISEDSTSIVRGNKSISVLVILIAIEDLQRNLVLKVLDEIFP